jgi:hypothetical protein
MVGGAPYTKNVCMCVMFTKKLKELKGKELNTTFPTNTRNIKTSEMKRKLDTTMVISFSFI